MRAVLLSLTALVFVFRIKLVISNESVEALINLVSGEAPDAFVFQFHSPKIDLKVLQTCFPCRCIVFSESHQSRMPRSALTSRYTQPSYLIFSRYSLAHISSMFNVTYHQGEMVSTVYLRYLHEHDDLNSVLQSLTEFVLPYINVIILELVTKDNLSVRKYFRYYIAVATGCDGVNCMEFVRIDTQNFLRHIKAPVLIHKACFQQGNGRNVPALVTVNLSYFYYSWMYKDPSVCASFAGTAKDNKIAQMCNYQIMVITELARIHNISFHVLKRRDFQIEKYPEFLLTYVGVHADHISHFFAGSGANYVFYCKTTNVGSLLNYRVWTDAFPWPVWVLVILASLILMLVFSGTKIFSMGLFQQFLSYLAAALGNDLQVAFSSQKNAKFIIFIFLAFFVRSLFENNVTSLLIIPEKPHLYSNLKELLNDQVKIVVFGSQLIVGHHVGLDLHLAGVSANLNSSFIFINRSSNIKSRLHYLANPQGGKYAALMDSSSLAEDHYKYSMEIVITSGRLDVSCNHLDKPLTPMFIFWLSTIINKHWIFETLHRIRDTGLENAWERWARNLRVLRHKLKYHKDEQRIVADRMMDVIDMKKIGSIGIFCCGVCCIASLLFAAEWILGKFKSPRTMKKGDHSIKIEARNVW